MKKSELRSVFLARQKSLAPEARRDASARAVRLLFENFDFTPVRFVNCFVTLEKNNELDTFEIFQRLWREFPNATTSAPRINFEMNTLENVRCSPETKFTPNRWQILEPEGDEIIDAQRLDAVLVPLVAFDEAGNRAGYGKGFYDRFLSRCRGDCRKIGLSLFSPVKKIEDVQNFDVPLNLCVTPERIWEFD